MSELTTEITIEELQYRIHAHENDLTQMWTADYFLNVQKELLASKQSAKNSADLKTLVISEIVDFYAGFESPGEPETVDEAQSQLIERIEKVFGLAAPVLPKQPEPTISFYREGIMAAAKWVEKQREEYDNEHGQFDCGTGSFEFGNDAQLEYSTTLSEIAEGIRSLHPTSAQPVSEPYKLEIDMDDADHFSITHLHEIIYGKELIWPEAKLLARFMLDVKQRASAAPAQESE